MARGMADLAFARGGRYQYDVDSEKAVSTSSRRYFRDQILKRITPPEGITTAAPVT
jgi:hypothetical protein